MDNKQTFKILNFNEAYEAPQNKINTRKQIVEWGKKNDYPNYILDLYNHLGSPTHKSIINKKVKLIAGAGFEDILDPNLQSIINNSELENEIKKATLDYELFNSFALEIIYTNGGDIFSIKHIPIHKLRIGVKSEEMNFDYYWFSNDWKNTRKEMYKPVPIRAFNCNVNSGKQIYVYNEYNPSTEGSYPIPGYSTSINWIELDYQMSTFHLNQIKQGYAPSFILNFATGIPSVEEMEEFNREFKNKYSGSENAGKIILTWSDDETGKPELTPIQLNDSDDRFVNLMERADEQIVRGAEIPPQLVILSPGKLGSTEERKDLLIEFQVTYITPRQENVEYVLNTIFKCVGITEDIKLKEYIVDKKTEIK